MFEPGIVVYVHVDTRVAAWRNNGEICVRAWKSSLCSWVNSRDSLEKKAGMFVFEPAKLGNDYGEFRVVAWRNSREIYVRAWKHG